MMEAVVLVVLVLGAGIWGLLASMQESDRRLRAWKDTVQSCGLQVTESLSSQLKARAGPLEVQIDIGDDKGRLVQILVVGPVPPDFYNLTIRPESVFHGREIEIGDPSFDSTFFIEGPPRLVFGLLDAETRRLLSRVNAESRLDLSWGKLRAEMADEKVAGILPLLLDLRKRFIPPIEIKQRLAENATKDPEPGVRLQNLLLLIRELPDDPGTVEMLRKACSDPSPEIRLQAAKKSGAEGRDVLLALAENPEDDDRSAEALSALAGELPFERTRVILERALNRRRPRTARICLEAIGRSGNTAAVDVLAKAMSREKGELATVAAQALEAIGSPASEPALILALQREQTDLQVAAAKALGRVGSVDAVLPLKEVADRFLPGDLRRAARQAVAEIQSRLQGASPGQLSLAGGEAGQLSLAQEGGELSLSDEPAGRLSLPEEDRPA
jgi:HEAT repeat protein